MCNHHPNSSAAYVAYLRTLIRELLHLYTRVADNTPSTRAFICDCRRASCPITFMPTEEGEEGDTLPPEPHGPSHQPTFKVTEKTFNPAPANPNDEALNTVPSG